MKRSNGTGNIVFLGKNRRNPWGIRISEWTIGECGERIRKRKVIASFRTRREAQSKIDALLSGIDSFERLRAQKRLLFKDCLDIALDRIAETHSDHTVSTYKTGLKHLKPMFNIPVVNLNGDYLQEFFESLCDAGYSKSLISTTLTVLKKGIKVALRKGVLTHDPTQGIEIGRRVKHKSKPRHPFSHDEIKRLFEIDDPMSENILIMIYTGLRLNEFLSCRKYENGFLHVENSKTNAGIRIIPVPAWLQPLVENRMLQGHLPDALCHITHFERKFKWFCDDHNMSHIPHETRHTYATLLDEARLPDGHRIDIVVTKVLCGHRVSDLTKGTYTHENIGRLIEAVNCMQHQWK